MIVSTHKLFQSAFALLAVAALSFCTGCKSYQLGHPTELPFETIYIQPAKNASYAPQAQALISAQVRELVIRDGRAKLIADKSQADAVLTLTLTDYERRGRARSQDDTVVAQNFDIILEAEIDLYDQKNGKFLFEGRSVKSRTNAYLDNPYRTSGTPITQGFIQSEHNAMPRLARELGRKVADELLSVW